MKFRGAEHLFAVEGVNREMRMMAPYMPFVCEEEGEALFSVAIADKVECEVVSTLIEDADMSDSDMVRINIYKTRNGLLYNIILPYREQVDGQLHIAEGDNRAVVAYSPSISESNDSFAKAAVFHNAMILSYIHFTVSHHTLLLHASAVIKDGRAHLFLGRSGTGKSTHSQMWLTEYADAHLMNDDHPVVRSFEDGRVIAYGSPWSGKTPCYRNESAPLAALVRIKRAKYNRLNRLPAIRAFASVMTTCSSMQWDEGLAEDKIKALEGIITHVGCYEMECLPEKEAARVCYTSLCNEK